MNIKSKIKHKSNKFVLLQRKVFNSIAQDNKKRVSLVKDDKASAFEIKTLLGFMPNISKSNILEVGSGTGRLTIPLAKVGKKITAIDVSEFSIRKLKDNASKAKLRNITAITADVNKLHLPKIFDYIVLVNVVHHIADLDLTFTKFSTLLKNDGKLILFEVNPLNPLFIPFLIIYRQFLVHMNKEYLRSNIWYLLHKLNSNNFLITNLYRYAYLPTVLYNISPKFIKINNFLNAIPLVNIFCAFHIISAKKK